MGASVVFQPIATTAKPGPGSIGRTNENGVFELQLFNGKAKGALIGKHKVSITAYEGDDEPQSSSADMPFRKALVPDKYNSETILTFEVPAGGTNEAQFDLEVDEKEIRKSPGKKKK